MTKFELICYVRALDERHPPCSRDIAQAFGIPRSQAAAYLCKNHGRGYLSRIRVGREYFYFVAQKGHDLLAYWDEKLRLARLAELQGLDLGPPEPVYLSCEFCDEGVWVSPRGAVDGVRCGCGGRMMG